MEVKLKEVDINKVYNSVALKHKVSGKVVKECFVKFLLKCSEDIQELEEGEYRIKKLGVFKLRKNRNKKD